MPYGLNFAPTGQRDPTEIASGQNQLGPTQRALKVMSLQLPRVLGSQAISPSSLLTPSPRPSQPISPESAVLQSLLRTFAPEPLVSPPTSPSFARPASTPAPAFGGATGGSPMGAGLSIEDLIRQIVEVITSGQPPPRVIPGQQPPGGQPPMAPPAAPGPPPGVVRFPPTRV